MERKLYEQIKRLLDNRGIERVHMCWENGKGTDMKRQSIPPKTNIKLQEIESDCLWMGGRYKELLCVFATRLVELFGCLNYVNV